MSWWQFLGEAVRRATTHAWEAAHHVYFFGYLISGATLIVAGWQLDKTILIATPLAVFVGIAAVGIWREAYHLYHAEHERRVGLELRADSPLRIEFDEVRHRYVEEPHKLCSVFRVSVTNTGAATARNVVLRIVRISGGKRGDAKTLAALAGVALSVSENPAGPIRAPADPPRAEALLHPGESAVFDVVRVCKRPGNHEILHSAVFRAWQDRSRGLFRWERRPDSVLSPGNYRLTVAASGDDLRPVEEAFEFAATTRGITFRRLAV
jgi:hypothetical protein